MRMLNFVAGMLPVSLMALGASVVSGQDYPNKPIRIFTAGAGGSSDIAGRIMAQGISGPLGQQVIIENRTGVIVAETVMRAPPDGYTLLFYSSSFWLSPFLRANPSWDPVRDFLPITMATTSPNILVVHPSLPVKSVKELIALAKAKPGDLNYASSSPGGTNHLSAELFKAMAGVDIVPIPYSGGGGAAVIGLLGGQVELMFATAPSAEPHVKSGKVRALAVTTAEQSALAPGLPTVAASGLPGYESAQMAAVFAPAKTPATIINRLSQEVVRVLNQANVKKKLLSLGLEPIGSSPEGLAAMIKSEMARMGKVIKDAGIRAE